MKVNCPNCRATIPADDISLSTAWAKCRRCDEIFRLADIIPDFLPSPPAPVEVKPERPYDAWTLLERDGEQLIIVAPARGMRSESWALLFFTLTWLGFISVWTFSSLHPLFHHPPGAPIHWERAVMAIFTVPFWMTGLGMLGAVIWSALGTRRVYLDPCILFCESRCLTWRRAQTIERNEVQQARESVLRPKSGGAGQSPLAVDLVFTKGPFKLPVACEEEQKWLVMAINEFLQEVPYRASSRNKFSAF